MIRLRTCFLPLVGMASACMAAPPTLPADETKALDPVIFFAGQTQGQATLNVVMSGSKPVNVDSVGRADGHGGLILTQRIKEGDKPVRVRTWTMHQSAPGRFTGLLIPDAIGPVSLTTSGPRADIAYRMKNGMTVIQQLALQADGRTLLNRLVVHKWGVKVAELDETIRKVR